MFRNFPTTITNNYKGEKLESGFLKFFVVSGQGTMQTTNAFESGSKPSILRLYIVILKLSIESFLTISDLTPQRLYSKALGAVEEKAPYSEKLGVVGVLPPTVGNRG